MICRGLRGSLAGVTQLGLGLDGVLVVTPDARTRERERRLRAASADQLSLLDDLTARRAATEPRVTPAGEARTIPSPEPRAPIPARDAPPARLGLVRPILGAPAISPAAVPPPSRAPAGSRLSPPPRVAPPAASLEPSRRRRPAISEEIRLEAELGRRIGTPILVRVTDNTSTMISFRRRGRALYVRAHRMFAAAPPEVLDALAHFVSRDDIPKDEAQRLDAWIEQHRDVLTEARSDALRIQPFGETHDLSAIFDRLNATLFAGRISATITWTRAAKGQRRTSIHMGTYSDELRLIRIHPALDQAWVPELFVEFVVFHEMLHQVHGVAGHGEGRRAVHPPAFRADEKRFPRYAEARRWEKDNLRRLLRY